MASSLWTAKRSQKHTKNCRLCKEQGAWFVPFIATSDFCLAPPAEDLLQELAEDLEHRWVKPKSVCISWARTVLALALARGGSACVRGGRAKPRAGRVAQFEDGAPVQGVFDRT